jgi:hypothetical protein
VLSLVFRLFLSQWINRDYEVMNTAVFVGALTAVLGSILVSLDTDELATLLGLPPSLADFLRYRLGVPEALFSSGEKCGALRDRLWTSDAKPVRWFDEGNGAPVPTRGGQPLESANSSKAPRLAK